MIKQEQLYWSKEDENRKERWAHLTLNEEAKLKVRDDNKRRKLEVLLDNTARWLIEKGVCKLEGNRIIVESTTTTDIGAFTTMAFPLVRRIWPELIANELVSVQPISQPTAKVFYLDFIRGSAGTPSSTYPSGQTLHDHFDSDYADTTEGGEVKEVNFRVSSVDVSAHQKKLKAKWTIEAQQDLLAYHGLDAEAEVMKILALEITREIDYEIINNLLTAATQPANSEGGEGAGNVNWSSTAPSTSPWNVLNPKEYQETLYDAILDANNLIFKKVYRNATWIIANPDTCAILEKLNDFKLDKNSAENRFNIGVHRFGTIKNRFLVYKHPDFIANKILVGFNGNSWLETGFVYAPYIPLYTTPLLIDADDFTPRRGILSRYATKVINAGCYATVTIV
ncbi:MAG: hypothetical protein JRI44_00185 [Deltaproteobacteria bacterium]|nr:hypothetical protein [Deltaproteobacteria bacterium]